MLVRSTLREIRTSLARYIAIFAIIALGVGFLSGLRVCRADMVTTADRYLEAHGMYDYMIVSTYGMDDESVSIAEEDGVLAAEGSVQIDVMAAAEDGADKAYRAISIPESINTLELVSGRMPEAVDECVADDYSMDGEGFKVGDRIVLSDSNDEDRLVSFKSREFTVVGTVNSPLYLDYQRGSTDIGNGSLSSYFYIDGDAFDVDYYTRLYLKLDGDEEYFSDAKSDMLDASEESMEALAKRITDARREVVTKEAQEMLSEPFPVLIGVFMTPMYEVEKDETLRRIGEIEADLEAANGGDAALREERDRLYRELRETEQKIADAGRVLDYAQRGLDAEDADAYYAVSLDQDPGYTSFESNSSIVNNVARVFPAFFFMIAALVCMTTMTRMIDEQRSQIGILKALGYSNAQVAGKYMAYSGSAAFIGAVTGFFVGCRIFPFTIWRAYGMLYDFSDELVYVHDARLGITALVCALICSVGATWASLSGDFRVSPSELIRPKAPAAGKRILLERITPLWSRISFLYKVSFRNVFRDRKRFLMMVIGVSGCTTLLIAAMGIGSSVAEIADHQFDEIQLYDYRVIFNTDMDERQQQDFVNYMDKEAAVGGDEIKFVHQDEVTLLPGEEEADVTCIAADGDSFGSFIDMHEGEAPVAFPGSGEAVIVRNLSREYGLEPGDRIRVSTDGAEGELTVSGVCDNYMYDTIYMSRETYEDAFGSEPAVRSALVRLKAAGEGDPAASAGTAKGSADGGLNDAARTGDSAAAVRETATIAANYRYTTAVSVNLDVRESIAKMMKSLDLVTWLIILSAAMLAFVVIYNLTNINITERIREIATIKVLGFYQNEVSQYIFRENMFMTLIAVVVGIPLGKWLLGFALDMASLRMLYFEARLTTFDIIKAAALTIVFSVLVNIVMQRRLRGISMTESLKSTE